MQDRAYFWLIIYQMDLDNILEQVKKYEPEKVILFGSYASGKQHKDSDIDLIIIKNTKKPFHDRLIEVRRLIDTTTPVDLLVFTPAEYDKHKRTNPFIAEIAETGRIIYENARGK